MKRGNILKESSQKKNSLKPNTASHNNTSWLTDANGIPEDSPNEGSLSSKGPALQELIPDFLGPSSCILLYKDWPTIQFIWF